MHHAVVHLLGSISRLVAAVAEPGESLSKDPGPIVPELKELAWGAGSFIVFALLMRFVLFPKLKQGMVARYEGIRNDHDTAERERATARAEVAEYDAQLSAVKVEATGRVDAARQVLEGERHAAITELNVRLNEQRSAALAQAEAARSAARDQIHSAVADVAGRAGELATGRRPDDAVVARVVNEVMAR